MSMDPWAMNGRERSLQQQQQDITSSLHQQQYQQYQQQQQQQQQSSDYINQQQQQQQQQISSSSNNMMRNYSSSYSSTPTPSSIIVPPKDIKDLEDRLTNLLARHKKRTAGESVVVLDNNSLTSPVSATTSTSASIPTTSTAAAAATGNTTTNAVASARLAQILQARGHQYSSSIQHQRQQQQQQQQGSNYSSLHSPFSSVSSDRGQGSVSSVLSSMSQQQQQQFQQQQPQLQQQSNLNMSRVNSSPYRVQLSPASLQLQQQIQMMQSSASSASPLAAPGLYALDRSMSLAPSSSGPPAHHMAILQQHLYQQQQQHQQQQLQQFASPPVMQPTLSSSSTLMNTYTQRVPSPLLTNPPVGHYHQQQHHRGAPSPIMTPTTASMTAASVFSDAGSARSNASPVLPQGRLTTEFMRSSNQETLVYPPAPLNISASLPGNVTPLSQMATAPGSPRRSLESNHSGNSFNNSSAKYYKFQQYPTQQAVAIAQPPPQQQQQQQQVPGTHNGPPGGPGWAPAFKGTLPARSFSMGPKSSLVSMNSSISYPTGSIAPSGVSGGASSVSGLGMQASIAGEDTLQNFIAKLHNRAITHLVLVLNTNVHRVGANSAGGGAAGLPSLSSQLAAQQGIASLRLLLTPTSPYLGVLPLSKVTHLSLHANQTLSKTARRLAQVADKARKVRDHVRRNRDCSVATLGTLITSVLAELKLAAEDTAQAFNIGAGSAGAVAAVMAVVPVSCEVELVGTDGGVVSLRNHFRVVWEAMDVLADTVAGLPPRAVAPVCGFAGTPFAVAELARRKKVELGSAEEALLVIAGYEWFRGGNLEMAAAILRNAWNLKGWYNPGERLQLGWLTAACSIRARALNPEIDNRDAVTAAKVPQHKHQQHHQQQQSLPPLTITANGQVTPISGFSGPPSPASPTSVQVNFDNNFNNPNTSNMQVSASNPLLGALPSTSLGLVPSLQTLNAVTNPLCPPLFSHPGGPSMPLFVDEQGGLILQPGEYTVLKLHRTSLPKQETYLSLLHKTVTDVGSHAVFSAAGAAVWTPTTNGSTGNNSKTGVIPPDGLTPQHVQSLVLSGSGSNMRSSTGAFSAIGSIVLRRGKKDAVASLMAGILVAARLGEKWEERESLVVPCELGGYIVVSSLVGGVETALKACWICVRSAGSKIRLALACSEDRGKTVCLGVGAYIGKTSGVEGPGIQIF